MAPYSSYYRFSTMAGSEAEGPRATRQGIDERPDFGPGNSSAGRGRFGDAIVRRADIRLRSGHPSADAEAGGERLPRSDLRRGSAPLRARSPPDRNHGPRKAPAPCLRQAIAD